MSKTTYWICAVNMVASAVALFLIFRSPTKPQIEFIPQSQEIAKPAESAQPPEATWLQFEQATNIQTAAAVLGQLPANAASLHQVVTFVEQQTIETPAAVDFARIGRMGAALRYLGTHCAWNDTGFVLLEGIAKNRQTPVILRDIALRSVVDAALRKHAVKETTDNAWRPQLANFLIQSNFGTETSIAGLALQAAAFVQNQGVITIDKAALATRLHEILKNHATVQETNLIASLEVAALVPETNMTDAIRPIFSAPRSDAVLQAAIACLGKIGTSDDLALLAKLPQKSAQVYHVTENAWLALTQSMPMPTPLNLTSAATAPALPAQPTSAPTK